MVFSLAPKRLWYLGGMISEFRVISGADPDLFQERLNRYLQNLDPDTEIASLLFSTTCSGESVTYSVLIGLQARRN